MYCCGFSEDIVLEILLRVPTKHLIRFKIICKSWNSIISHPKFLKTHLFRSQSFIIKTISEDDKPSYFTFSLPSCQVEPLQIESEEDNNLLFHHSCNNLMLVQTGSMYHVYNHVDAQFKTFPETYFSPRPRVSSCVVVHDPSSRIGGKYKVFKTLPETKFSRRARVSSCVVVHDPSTRIGVKYKVFVLGFYRAVEAYFCHRYIQGKREWEPILVPEQTCDEFTVLASPVLLGNVLLWFVKHGYQGEIMFCLYQVSLRFDEAKPRLTRIPGGIVQAEQEQRYLLSEMGGCLCLTIAYTDRLDAWILKDKAYNLWTKCNTVSLCSLPSKPSFLDTFLSDNLCIVMGDLGDKSVLPELIRVLINHENKLFLYDLMNQELRQITSLATEQKLSGWYQSHCSSQIRWNTYA